MAAIRRLREGDADALASFYNGLSSRSKRTFHPLDETTTVDVCRAIAVDNLQDTKLDLVAEVGRQIVGWSFVWCLQEDEPTFGLCVADAYQGQGLGSRLIDRALSAARQHGLSEVHLTVVQDNLVALGLYERRGFACCGEIVGQDGLAYYRMRVIWDTLSGADCTPVQDRFHPRV